MQSITLYPIHSDGEHVQYAGHILLWESDEVSANAIARAMLIGPIVGVEVCFTPGLGKEERQINLVGLSYTEAVVQTMGAQ